MKKYKREENQVDSVIRQAKKAQTIERYKWIEANKGTIIYFYSSQRWYYAIAYALTCVHTIE